MRCRPSPPLWSSTGPHSKPTNRFRVARCTPPTWLGWHGTASPAEVAGAFLVNLEAWGSCCARMAEALPGAYRLTVPE